MSAQHTPGPWERRGLTIWQPHKTGLSIAVVTQHQKAAIADANLIAAAPELLDALIAADAHFGPFAEITVNGVHDPDDVRVTALIRAAIAKATGAS